MLVKLQSGKLVNYGIETVITNTHKYAYNRVGWIDYPIKNMYEDYDYQQDYNRSNIHAKTAEGDNFYNDELMVYITYPDIPLGESERSSKIQYNYGESEGVSFSKSNKKHKKNTENSSTYNYDIYSETLFENSSKTSEIKYKSELALKITNKDIPTYYWNIFVNSLDESIKKESLKNIMMLETLSQVNINIDELDKVANKKIELALCEFSIQDFINDQIKKYKNEYCPCCKRYKQDVFCLHYNDRTKAIINKEEVTELYKEVMMLDDSGSSKDEYFNDSDLANASKRFKEVLKEIESLKSYGFRKE